MSKSNLSTIVSNITREIEANSNLREILNTYKHEYTLDIEDLEKEALYQLGDLIETIDSPSDAEIKRRKDALRKSLEKYSGEIFKALKDYKGQANLTFRRGSTETRFTVLIVGGKKAKGSGLVDVFDVINSIRRRKLPDLRDSIFLDVFLANDNQALDRALYGNKYINRFDKEVRGGGLFQLGHEKQGSVSVRRKAQILDSLSKAKGSYQILKGTSLSKEEKATIQMEVATYAKREAGNLLKQFTTTLKVTEESAKNNLADSSKESAFLNALSSEVKNHLLKKVDIFKLKTSSSVLDIVEATLAAEAKKAGAKVKKDKKAVSSKSVVKKSVVGKTTKSSGREAFYTQKILNGKQEREQPSWSSIVNIINKMLPDKMAENMRSPALNYRTGRLANSARVVNVETTKEGYASIVFDYDRDPYNVFDKTLGRSPWNTPERDPRALVDKSIREIAKELAIGRFYTRRA